MNISEHLAAELVRDLLGEQIEGYRRSLLQGEPARASDVYSAAMVAFRSLDVGGQRSICEFFKIVSVNAVSVTLGYVDGSSIIPGLDDELSVSYAGKDISGELQDSFLRKVEDAGLLATTNRS